MVPGLWNQRLGSGCVTTASGGSFCSHCQSKSGATGTKGWESGEIYRFPCAEEGRQGSWGLHGMGVTETHKTWSDIYWGSGASSPPYSNFRLIGFQCGTRAGWE